MSSLGSAEDRRVLCEGGEEPVNGVSAIRRQEGSGSRSDGA
jgi:hypothetical protein